jgi:hypothetical protein
LNPGGHLTLIDGGEITPVPLPVAIALFPVALGLLGFYRRRVSIL